MKSAWSNFTLGIVLASGVVAPAVYAEDEVKSLPTLLVKGEVVSLDTSDPAANLLKVKDRYGFETQIYLTPETKISQGDAAATVASLTASSAVEVEYNFDINTAKRHAVSVKLAAPAAAQTATGGTPATAAAAPIEAATPATPGATAAPAEAAPQASATPAAPAAAATQAPAGTATGTQAQ